VLKCFKYKNDLSIDQVPPEQFENEYLTCNADFEIKGCMDYLTIIEYNFFVKLLQKFNKH